MSTIEKSLKSDARQSAELSNRRSRDVAIFLSGLPEQQLTQILSQLPLEQAQKLTETITGLGVVSEIEKRQVAERFQQEAGFEVPVSAAGRNFRVDPAHQSETAISTSGRFVKKSDEAPPQAELTWDSLVGSDDPRHEAIQFVENQNDVFGFCSALNSAQLADGLTGEDPQSIAIVLAHVNKSLAAKVLTVFDIDWRLAIVRRMANMSEVSTKSTTEIATRIKNRIIEQESDEQKEHCGLQKVSAIFGELDTTTRQTLIDCLTVSDLSLARRLSQQCLTVEDIVRLSDQEIKLTLAAIDTSILAPALVDCRSMTRQKVFKNMAEKAAKILEQEIEEFRPTSIDQVRRAQQKLLDVVAAIHKTYLSTKEAAA